ncbi:HXXEE domain-containing protein [Butyrivibrio sp. NC3005]|uniref:HXXEE domain-containing protein n=1 Tax=Butyrivibrio sp. NC3005 TaxID=1280685 RepID=UPI0003FB9605|nr:HXXEE domain-containing protein [Butyrivibrio sp. NC3005]
MDKYALLFPIIFIFHDMEEIIGFGFWLDKNRNMLKNKYPSIAKTYKNFSTEGFALAVFEEFIVCTIVSVLALYTKITVIEYIWLGGFIGCAIHFIIHILQSLFIKQYIPALATSIISLPISILIIYKCFAKVSNVDFIFTMCILLGIAIVVINLKFAQSLIGCFSKNI